MGEKKYVFFDIDGTLAMGRPGNQYVPESTTRAIEELKRRGHFVAIATGRSHYMAEGYRKQFGFDHMVSDGGNGVTIDGKVLHIHPLDRDKCLALIRECDEKGFSWAIQPEDSRTRYAPTEQFYEDTKDIYIQTKVVKNMDLKDYPNIYKMYVACREEEESQIEMLGKMPTVRYHEDYVFIEPTDKYRGIREVVEYVGGDIRDVVVFGDGTNDLSMFLPVWTSVAMGNAVDELKERADYVTDDIDRDGIYKALVHLGLIEDFMGVIQR